MLLVVLLVLFRSSMSNITSYSTTLLFVFVYNLGSCSVFTLKQNIPNIPPRRKGMATCRLKIDLAVMAT